MLYLTEPDLPLAAGAALVSWVKAGGTLITVAGAGQFDEYDEPSPSFQTALFGTVEAGETSLPVRTCSGTLLGCFIFP